MKLDEERLSGRTVFSGRILQLEVDAVRLPDGQPAEREVVRHPGGVGVVALTAEDEVLLVRQFRYPYGAVVTEIPAGKRDPGEEPLCAGMRELEEETGYRAAHFEPLGVVYPSPGYTDEVIHLFLATGLQKTAAHPDEDEFLDVVRCPLERAVERVFSGDFPDAKTQVALLKVWNKRRK